MKAIIGLGNPGSEYEATRHNLGFVVADLFARERGSSWQEKFDCNFMRFQLEGHPCLLVKPLKYMNLSGEAAVPLLKYFKVLAEDIVVLHDELDLVPGTVRVKLGGTAGGHNGVKDLISHLGTDKFVRVRLGIGHPRDIESRQDVSSWVLSRPRAEEKVLYEEAVVNAKDAVKEVLSRGLVSAQRKFNKK